MRLWIDTYADCCDTEEAPAQLPREGYRGVNKKLPYMEARRSGVIGAGSVSTERESSNSNVSERDIEGHHDGMTEILERRTINDMQDAAQVGPERGSAATRTAVSESAVCGPRPDEAAAFDPDGDIKLSSTVAGGTNALRAQATLSASAVTSTSGITGGADVELAANTSASTACSWGGLADTLRQDCADAADVDGKTADLLSRLDELAACSTISEVEIFVRSPRSFTPQERDYLTSPLLDEIYGSVVSNKEPDLSRQHGDIFNLIPQAVIVALYNGYHQALQFFIHRGTNLRGVCSLSDIEALLQPASGSSSPGVGPQSMPFRFRLNMVASPLLLAACSGSVQCTEIVMNGTQAKSTLDAALVIASAWHWVDVVARLLAAGADARAHKSMALRCSVHKGQVMSYPTSSSSLGADPTCKRMMLDLQSERILHISDQEGAAIMSLLRDRSFPSGILSRTGVQCRDSVIRMLLQAGSNVHASHDEALRVAVCCGLDGTVAMLMQSGADVNADDGQALRCAVSHGTKNIVETLLTNQEANSANRESALRIAANKMDLELIEILLAADALVSNDSERVLHASKAMKWTVAAIRHHYDSAGSGMEAEISDKLYHAVSYFFARCANLRFDDGAVLQAAVEMNSVTTVLLLLNEAADVNAQSGKALNAAIAQRCPKIIALLVSAGAAVFTIEDVLVPFAREGLVFTVTDLLRAGAVVDFDLLLNASALDDEPMAMILDAIAKNPSCLRDVVRNGRVSSLTRLLDAGLDFQARAYVLDAAVRFDQAPLAVLLIERGTSDDEAVVLAQMGFTTLAALLLENGADVPPRGDDALRSAARNSHLEIARMFLDKGADVHACNEGALIGAARNGHNEMVHMLVERGANVDAFSDVDLLLAAERGHTDIVRMLLKNCARLARRDNATQQSAAHSGITDIAAPLGADAELSSSCDSALVLAVEHGHVDVIRILLRYGADVSTSDYRVVRIAVEQCNAAMLRLLLRAGGAAHAVESSLWVEALTQRRSDIVHLLLNASRVIKSTGAKETSPELGSPKPLCVQFLKLIVNSSLTFVAQDSVLHAVTPAGIDEACVNSFVASQLTHCKLFFLVVQSKEIKLVQLLLAYAGPMIPTHDVNSALRFAGEHGWVDLFRVLLEHRFDAKHLAREALPSAARWGRTGIINLFKSVRPRVPGIDWSAVDREASRARDVPFIDHFRALLTTETVDYRHAVLIRRQQLRTMIFQRHGAPLSAAQVSYLALLLARAAELTDVEMVSELVPHFAASERHAMVALGIVWRPGYAVLPMLCRVLQQIAHVLFPDTLTAILAKEIYGPARVNLVSLLLHLGADIGKITLKDRARSCDHDLQEKSSDIEGTDYDQAHSRVPKHIGMVDFAGDQLSKSEVLSDETSTSAHQLDGAAPPATGFPGMDMPKLMPERRPTATGDHRCAVETRKKAIGIRAADSDCKSQLPEFATPNANASCQTPSMSSNQIFLQSNKETLLARFVRQGHVSMVQLLLDHKLVDIESMAAQDSFAVAEAVRRGHYEILQMLVDAGCFVDVAQRHGQVLQSTAAPGEHLLRRAVQSGNEESVWRLLNQVEGKQSDAAKAGDLTEALVELCIQSALRSDLDVLVLLLRHTAITEEQHAWAILDSIWYDLADDDSSWMALHIVLQSVGRLLSMSRLDALLKREQAGAARENILSVVQKLMAEHRHIPQRCMDKRQRRDSVDGLHSSIEDKKSTNCTDTDDVRMCVSFPKPKRPKTSSSSKHHRLRVDAETEQASKRFKREDALFALNEGRKYAQAIFDEFARQDTDDFVADDWKSVAATSTISNSVETASDDLCSPDGTGDRPGPDIALLEP